MKIIFSAFALLMSGISFGGEWIQSDEPVSFAREIVEFCEDPSVDEAVEFLKTQEFFYRGYSGYGDVGCKTYTTKAPDRIKVSECLIDGGGRELVLTTQKRYIRVWNEECLRNERK